MNNKAKKQKKSNFSIKKLIYNDKYLIIISIVLALFIWIAISMNLSPETKKTISVPVTIDFSGSAADQLGIKCFGDKSIDVDVTISCKKYLAKDITADDINVYLQTSTVTSKGTAEVPIKVDASSSEFEIESYYPTVYRAYFDVEDERVMDIELEYAKDSFVADGYIMGDPVLSTPSVTVTGAKSYVSRVSKVVGTVDFDEKISSTQTIELSLYAIDSYGTTVDYVYLKNADDFTLTVPVFKRTTLNVASSFTGKPAGVDIKSFGVSYSVNKINAGVLEDANIVDANIGNIDFSKLNVGRNKFTVKTSALEGIIVLDDINEITVNVTVPSTYATTTVPVSTNNVNIINVPDGYTATLAKVNSSSVTVVGKPEDLEKLSSMNVVFSLDLSDNKNNFSENMKTFNVAASLENADTCWIYGNYTVDLNIEKQ